MHVCILFVTLSQTSIVENVTNFCILGVQTIRVILGVLNDGLAYSVMIALLARDIGCNKRAVFLVNKRNVTRKCKICTQIW